SRRRAGPHRGIRGQERTPRAPARAYLSLLPSGPGEVHKMTPHEGSAHHRIGLRARSVRPLCTAPRTRVARPRAAPARGPPAPPPTPPETGRSTPEVRVELSAEDSPRGLGRTLGKRVGGNPSRVRISYPPPASTRQNEGPRPGARSGPSSCPGSASGSA